MTTHRLKVLIKYADATMNGTKTFEVRKNDRNFKVGDKIVFDVVTNEGFAVGAAARHPPGVRRGVRHRRLRELQLRGDVGARVDTEPHEGHAGGGVRDLRELLALALLAAVLLAAWAWTVRALAAGLLLLAFMAL